MEEEEDDDVCFERKVLHWQPPGRPSRASRVKVLRQAPSSAGDRAANCMRALGSSSFFEYNVSETAMKQQW